MDLPEEDNTAIAKRRAIQSLMRNKSLTPAQRNMKMQEIMKGNLPMDDSDDDESDESDESDYDDDDDSRSTDGSYSERSDDDDGSSSDEDDDDYSSRDDDGDNRRRDNNRYDDDDDDSDESSSGDDDNGTEDGGESIGDFDGSASQYSMYSRGSASQYSRDTRDTGGGGGGGGSRTGGGSRSNNNNNGRGIQRNHSDRSASSAASSATASAQNKDKQKALLEVSRDKSLSAKERQAKMKEIMQTPVRGIVAHRANSDTEVADDVPASASSSATSAPPSQRPSLGDSRGGVETRRRPRKKGRDGNKERESIKEPRAVGLEDKEYQPIRVSRRRVTENVPLVRETTDRISRNDPTLQRVELQKMNLTDGDVIPLLEALGGNTTVTSLDLRRNRIGIEGCSTLASAILDNKTLRSVDVSGNNLGDEGLEDLSKVIPYNRTLEALNVEDNKIGDAGARAFAEALLDNVALREVNLSGNLIGDDGAADLFKALSSESSEVISMLLRFNAISDKGATELASALLDNEALTVVDLGYNKITDVGAKDLLKVVGINDTLETLELGGNVSIGEEMLEDIHRALEEESDDDEYDSGDDGTESWSGEETEDGEESEYSEMDTSGATTTSAAKEEHGRGDEDEDADATPTGGEAMLEDMPDENDAALAKRQLIQKIMRDRSLSGIERNKKIQDVMAGKVELPRVEKKKPEPKPKPKPKDDESEGSEESNDFDQYTSEEEEEADGDAPADGDAQLTGGEAMLEDMPDETDSALAKRQAIQGVMRDKSLSSAERNKKIQDIMAGRVELPRVVKKKPEPKPKSKPSAAKPAVSSSRFAVGNIQREEEDDESEDSEESEYASQYHSEEDADGDASNGDGQLTGGEAMLTDMPDETDTALAKRQAIQGVMRDKSLSGAARNKKIQDIMTGKVELPKYTPPKKPKQDAREERGGRRARKKEEDSARSTSGDEGGPQDAPASSGDGAQQLNGGEAMLEDMPDESDAALAKRQAIQGVMRDKSLSGAERNKKIQDIMAGRVELPRVEKKRASPAAKPPANQNRRPAPRRRSQEESDESSEGSDESSYYSEDDSRRSGRGSPTSSVENDDSNMAATGNTAATAAEPNGGEAMLTDMPDESDKTLAKRRAIQELMRDKSLSGPERTKKIQDVMAGRAKLPPPPPPKPVAAPSLPPKKSRAAAKAATMSAQNDKNKKKKAAAAASGNDAAATPRRRGSGAEERKRATQQQQQAEVPKPKKGNDAATGRQPSLQNQPKVEAAKANNKKLNQPIQRKKKAPALLSNDGGTRAAIAHEWKRRMMAVHPRSHDDLLDVLLAHKYRLSLKSPPRQSFFRVVAVVFFALVDANGNRRDERYHVVGTNDEPHSIGGSICAERAALMQLRFMPDLDAITKVVIVSDDADSISPGMLCREFMASHDRVPWDVPIVMGRSVCRKCGFTVSGKACGDAAGRFDEAGNAVLRDANADLFGTCGRGHDEEKNNAYPTPHDFVGAITTLRELFPYPSLYARITSTEARELGEKYAANNTVSSSSPKSKNGGDQEKTSADGFLANNRMPRRFSEDQSVASYRQENFDLTMLANIMEEDEEGGGQGIATDGDEMSQMSQSTMGRMSQSSLRKLSAASPVKSSMSKSLKTTIDFMKHLREDQSHHGPGINGHNGSGDFSFNQSMESNISAASLEHLTARTIRISSRLKPSQRREKLLRLATEVTALETYTNQGMAANSHPIRYGAAVLFSDGTVAIAAQKVAIEYGCTLDAVGQLASAIDMKSVRLEEDAPSCRPILLAQCDQFGIAHAPFAQGRAFLTERGYGDCKVLVHQRREQPGGSGEGGGGSSDNGGGKDPPARGDEKAEEEERRGAKSDGDAIDLRLLEVGASSLAPAPPNIFGGVMTKTHTSQGGLQIQF